MNFFKKKKKTEPKDEMEIVLSEDTEMKFNDYPKGDVQISPFEPIDGGNYFSVAGTMVSYLGSFEDYGNIEFMDITDKRNLILKGAFVLNIHKRLAIIENGELIYYNKNFDDGFIIDKSSSLWRWNIEEGDVIDSHWNRLKLYDDDGNIIESSRKKLIKFVVILERKIIYKVSYVFESYEFHDINRPLQLRVFEDEESAVKFATELSVRYGIKCIVAQWFSDIDRH
jgi:hypothetical protein